MPCLRKEKRKRCNAGRGATGFLLMIRYPFWVQKIGLAAERPPSSQECEPGRIHQCEGQTKGSQAQPSMPMKPTDLLTATVFGKRAAPKTSPRVAPILGFKIWTPKWGRHKKECIRPPRFGVQIRAPKRGPALGLFLLVSAHPFARRRVQACWLKRSPLAHYLL